MRLCDIRPTILAMRSLIVAIGLAIASAGIVFYMKSGLGMDAFSVFCGGIARVLGISFGLSLQICLFVLMGVIALLDWRLLGIGTLMHALLMGFFIDLYVRSGWVDPAASPLAALVYVGIGVFLVGTGLAVYLKAGLGSGAIDALMLLVHARLGREIRWIKTGLDLALAAIGFALGGRPGIATIASVVFTGPVIQRAMRLIGSLERQRECKRDSHRRKEA